MCVTGEQKACPCLGGGQGVQVCLADGTYQACVCPATQDFGDGAPSGGNDDLTVPPANDDGGAGGALDLSVGDLAALDLSVGDLASADLAPLDLSSASSDLAGADLAPIVSITCGAQACTGTQLCCLAGSATNGSCVPSGNGCSGGASPFACDGPEDCAGAFCCVYVDARTSGSLSGRAQCGASCTGSLTASGSGYIEQSRLCHSDADCANYTGTLLGVPTSFASCCHSATTAPYHVCIPGAFASLGGFTCP